jgi:hypothetical protein
MYIQYAPYKLNGGLVWNDELKNTFADRCVDLLGVDSIAIPYVVSEADNSAACQLLFKTL